MDKKKRIAVIAGAIVLLIVLIASICLGVSSCGKEEPADIEPEDEIEAVEESEEDNKLPDNYEESEDFVLDGEVPELVVTSDMLLEDAMFAKNNDMESLGEITATKNGVQLKIEGGYNALKSLYVRGFNLPTAGVDTMSVRIRSLGPNGFTRFRLYLCSTPSEKMDSNKVIDSAGGDDAIYPELISVTDPDAQGWQTVTIKVGDLPYWKHTTNITGFNFAFLSKDDVQEVKDIRFNMGGTTYRDAGYNYTSGYFPADVLYRDGVAVKDNKTNQKGTAQLTDTGVRYTLAGSDNVTFNGLKSIYVDDIALNPDLYDTMTVRIRSLGSEGFTRFRLYLNTSIYEKIDSNKLIDTSGDSPMKADLVTVTEPDVLGWQTVTIKVGQLDVWKKSDVITAFNFGYLSKDATQEIKEIRFSRGGITYEDSKLDIDFTSGNYTKDVLVLDAIPLMNNNPEQTGTATLKSTGVEYKMVREDQSSYNGLKSIFVDDIALDTTAYDTMTIRIRDLDGKAFTRFRLYLQANEEAAPDTNKLIDTGGSPTLNANLLSITDPDEYGWQIVTIRVGELEFWKNNPVLRSFNFGYLNLGDVQEISQIIFSKGAPQLDLSGKEEVIEPEEPTPPAGYTQGTFSAGLLYEYGTPVYNNNRTLTSDAKEALTEEKDAVNYTFTQSNSLKSVYLEGLNLNPEQFDKMTVRLRSLDGGSFGIYRLYLCTEKDEDLTKNDSKVIDSGNASFYKNLVSVKNITVDGETWKEVTFDLSNLPAWTNAEYITGINFGYTCHPGTQQQIAEIQLTKDTEDEGGSGSEGGSGDEGGTGNEGGTGDDGDTEIGEEVKASVENGQFPADVLYAVSAPVYDNKTDDTASKKALSEDGESVTYTFEKSLAEKSIVVEDLTWDPDTFTRMTVRLKSDTAFERFRLYLNDGLYGTPVIDVRADGTTLYGSGNVGTEQVTLTQGEDGWLTVAIDVQNLSAWTSSESIRAFRFSYVNEGSVQSVSNIEFTKAEGNEPMEPVDPEVTPTPEVTSTPEVTPTPAEPLVIEGAKLYELSDARYNNGVTSQTKEQQESSIKYTIQKGNALKSVYLSDLSLNTAEYDTLAIKIRSVNGKDFSRYRLYLFTETLANIGSTSNLFIDTNGSNANLLTKSEPDEDGWITVTIKVGELDYWKNNAAIMSMNFGWVNTDTVYEIESITFDKSE